MKVLFFVFYLTINGVFCFLEERGEDYSLFPPDFIQSLKNDPVASLPELYDYIMEDVFYLQLPANNESCGDDWGILAEQSQTEKMFGKLGIPVNKAAIAIDSFGKPQDGFFRGNLRYMGNYDECMSIDTKSLDFSMQYCQIAITFSVLQNGTVILPLQLSEALCLPTSCTLREIVTSIGCINRTLSELKVPIHVGINAYTFCTPQGGLKFTTGAVIMIFVSCLFVALSLLATAVDLSLYVYQFIVSNKDCNTSINADTLKLDFHESDSLLRNNTTSIASCQPNRCIGFLREVMYGFSLYKTVPAVLSTKQPAHAITCINGLRVISMFWVILCHTFVFILMDQDFTNPYYLLTTFVSRFTAQSILNGFFSVDSFFFLSGLLVAYLTLRQMKKTNGRFPFLVYYVHRILRLTPTYMFVLFFYWHVSVHLGTGPTVLATLGPDSMSAQVCKSYWWTNLLYINNFHPRQLGQECLGWSWYLANDMQFYVISPLLLIPLYYWMPSGIIALCLTLLSSFGVTGLIAGYYGYPANVIKAGIGSELKPGLPDPNDEIYIKPYCRITPYLVGIFLGYLLYKRFRLPFKTYLSAWFVHITMWLMAAFLGMINVYGLYSSWNGHTFSTAENVLYYMFSRFTWGVTLALVVFVCHNGYGGVINKFLSLPIWIPLSRITFNAYLVHEMIMLLLFGELRHTFYYTDTAVSIYVIGLVVLSYAAAGAVSVFVEYPLSNLETAVFKAFGVSLHSSTRRGTGGERPRDITSPLETAVRIG